MQITETFAAPDTKAARLFWLPAYIALSREVYRGFMASGETYEAKRFLGNCSARWGITKACAESLLKGEAVYSINDDTVTVTRNVPEE